MIRSLTIRPQARVDLLEQAAYFRRRENSALAERYLDAVDRTLRLLCRNPRIGARYRSAHPLLGGIRSVAVEGFEKHLVFYLPGPKAIDIIRVLHGSRDLRLLIGDEAEI